LGLVEDFVSLSATLRFLDLDLTVLEFSSFKP